MKFRSLKYRILSCFLFIKENIVLVVVAQSGLKG
jgi:hypothetical protein